MSKEIIRQLKSLQHADIRPNEEWLQKNRELLLSQINNTISTDKKRSKRFGFKPNNIWQAVSIFLPQAFVYRVVRPIATVVLILTMGIGSWVTAVSASYEALPGDRLYSAKRVIEKTQAAVVDAVGDKNDAARLHGEFALRRARETGDLVAQHDPNKVEIVAQTVNDLKDEMKTVNTKLEEIKTTDGTGTEGVKNVNQTTQAIQKVLKEVKVNLLVADAASTGNLSSQVLEAKNLVKETAVKAVEVMVVKHQQGDSSVSKGEVEQAINEQLQSAVNEAAASKLSVEEVNKALGVVKNEVNAINQDIKNSPIDASTTQSLSAKIEETSKQTQAAVNATQQFNVEAGQTVGEGQLQLSQGDLAKAVDQVKKANEVSSKIEKITDDTLKAVQGILPVVAVVADGTFMTSSPVFSTTTITTTPSSTPVSSTVKVTGTTTPVIVLKSTTTKQ